MNASRAIGLTKREDEILGLLSKGKRYKEIAQELFISTETVRNMYKKLGVRSAIEAINVTGVKEK
jgi:DNA-binding NarL/FixJ family response regulator